MYEIQKDKFSSKDEFYTSLLSQGRGLMEGERDLIANIANISALLFLVMDNINWAGFYLMKNDELVLGPFQGKPACIRIPIGRGVCGTAVSTKVTQCIENVHAFPGHIACDSASNSEIVVPMIKGEKVLGVLDIDSPILRRFDEKDVKYLEELVSLILENCDWPEE